MQTQFIFHLLVKIKINFMFCYVRLATYYVQRNVKISGMGKLTAYRMN